MTKKYTPSGAAPAIGIIKTIGIGIISAIILPLLYIIANRLIPNIWFAAISAVLLGLGLGYAINWGVKFGKLRNVKIATAVAVFCGILAYYMQWVIFDELMYSEKGFTFNLNADDIKNLASNILYLFSHPAYLWSEITTLNEVGTFSIKGSGTFSGTLLWLVWLGEFLIIIGSVLYFVLTGAATEPYSESNDAWMQKRKPNLIIPYIENKEEIIRHFDSNNFEILKDNSNQYDNIYAEVIIHESPNDPLRYITINNISVEKKKNDKEEIKKENIVKNYPILSSVFNF